MCFDFGVGGHTSLLFWWTLSLLTSVFSGRALKSSVTLTELDINLLVQLLV